MMGLLIFIDEPGDVGSCSDYYLVGFAFHDQSVDISASINRYRRSLSDAGLIERAFHFIPVIRGHEQYAQIDLSLRKRSLMRFQVLLRKRRFVARFHESEQEATEQLVEPVRRPLVQREDLE